MNHQQVREEALRWILDVVRVVKCIEREELVELVRRQWGVGNETALAYIHRLSRERPPRITVDSSGWVRVPEAEPECTDSNGEAVGVQGVRA